ncbi:MAG TPA: pirin family protein [Nitrososphaera sp.]|nr:pirin family protein [Nitrososphaera sp.]
MLKGSFQRNYSGSNAGRLGPGDVQWMTAGAGMIHSQMPSKEFVATEGRRHGFQLWVNLPRRDKLVSPLYQDIPPAKIPVVASAENDSSVRMIAGEALGKNAVIETHTPIM